MKADVLALSIRIRMPKQNSSFLDDNIFLKKLTFLFFLFNKKRALVKSCLL